MNNNMTPERQNEIWAMLPKDFKEQLGYDYAQANVALAQDPTNVRIDTHKRFLEKYFGSHNLTAQAEDKPKEPKFNIGEKVRINCYSNGEVWDAVSHNRIVTIQDYYVKDGVNMYVLKEGCRDFGEHCLEPYTEPKEVVKTSDENSQNSLNVTESVKISTNEDAYFTYRLDLAKEIAVAMIPDGWNMEIAKRTVDLANEIVKLLKETEE